MFSLLRSEAGPHIPTLYSEGDYCFLLPNLLINTKL